MKNKQINYYQSESNIKTVGYFPKFPKCPYLSTNGNKCSRKYSPKRCIYSNNPEKCDHYNKLVKQRKIDCGDC